MNPGDFDDFPPLAGVPATTRDADNNFIAEVITLLSVALEKASGRNHAVLEPSHVCASRGGFARMLDSAYVRGWHFLGEIHASHVCFNETSGRPLLVFRRP